MRSLISLAALAALFSAVSAEAPTAKTKNGTYQGAYLPDWNQDAFLGMPYAQPPVGPLRFKWPQSVNTSFDGVRNATQYGYSCPQYGTNFSLSEDCLTINVVRPSGVHAAEPLPVVVWIYGGGLYAGSTADPQYNLSGLVKVSQEMDRPMIAVSMNYRLGIWGFLQTPQLLVEGSSNAGLLDQRLALHWVQENIASFGGDPSHVTVWGESAGAQSIAYQLFAYGGRNDNLFRAAIMESGGPQGCQVETLSWYNSAYENVSRAVGCWPATSPKNQLACVRGVDQATLFNAHPSVVWNPLIDGDFLQGYPSQLIQQGKYVRVPIITGANTDEGFAISDTATGAIDDERDIFTAISEWRSYSITFPTLQNLLKLYPDDPCSEPPYAITNCSVHPSRGKQWRRAFQIGADLVMLSGRRKMAEHFTSAGQKVFSYRFDQRPYNPGDEWDGVKHFVNVAFSFQNISGLLGPSPPYDSHVRLAGAIGRAYVNFVHDLDPNGMAVAGKTNGSYGDKPPGPLLPQWPVYDLAAPTNMVLNATRSYVEPDSWRKEAIAYINSPEVSKEMQG